MAVSTAQRVDAVQRRRNDQTGEFVLVGGLIGAGVLLAILLGGKSAQTTQLCVPPCGNGATCVDGTCQGGATCPSGHPAVTPSTLYQTHPSGSTWFVDHTGQARYGVPSQTQIDRCFSPAQIAATVVAADSVFGNADTGDFVPTIGDIMGCSVCPT